MSRRPNRKAIEKMMAWLNEQNITLYTGNADIVTGQRDFGCMDITTVDEVIAIYEHNKNNTWLKPIY
jgi:hypothetical protein